MSVSIVWQLFDWSLHLKYWRAIGWAASGSDHLDIVGRVESNLTAAQLSFTPALLVLVTELQQLLTWNKHKRKSDVCMKWCLTSSCLYVLSLRMAWSPDGQFPPHMIGLSNIWSVKMCLIHRMVLTRPPKKCTVTDTLWHQQHPCTTCGLCLPAAPMEHLSGSRSINKAKFIARYGYAPPAGLYAQFWFNAFLCFFFCLAVQMTC